MKILLYILLGALGVVLGVIALIILYFLFIFINSLFINTKREYNTNSKYFRFLLNTSTWIAIKILRIKLDVNGMEKVPEGTQMLLVCNHRSNFDPIIKWYVFRKNTPAFISKEENFNVPFYGRIIRKCCFMAIDRENPRNAMKTIDRASKLIQAKEVSIAVYPEGTRSKEAVLLPFHSGVFKIAQKADVPVVITSIQGTEKIHKNFPLHSTKVTINVLDVFSAESIKGQKTADVSEKARNIIGMDLGDIKELPENKEEATTVS